MSEQTLRDAIAVAKENAERAAQRREERGELLRQNMPEVVVALNEFREIFGEGIKCRWAKQNGFEIRTKDSTIDDPGVIASVRI
jgi:hypothetical protein